MLWLDCIWTTTYCDRDEDFRPDKKYFLARSCGCRRSRNASRQDRLESTCEVQITPARRVGARLGVRPSSPNAITLHTIDALRHRCRWPPVIPSEVASPELWKTLLREVRVQIGYKGAQPLFTQRHEPLNHAVLSGALSTRCRLCIRFGHSPPLQGPQQAWNHMEDRSPGSPLPTLTRIRTGHPTSPRHPVLLVDRHGVVGLARHRPTRWLDRVDDHAPTAWVHEHGYLSLPPFPTSVAAGRTRISHLVSRPWAYVPTWILAAASLPGLYGIVRGITLWPDLPTLPRRRAWLGWTQVALTAAFVAVCLVVAWPKA